jgi:hypothetical protein
MLNVFFILAGLTLVVWLIQLGLSIVIAVIEFSLWIEKRTSDSSSVDREGKLPLKYSLLNASNVAERLQTV